MQEAWKEQLWKEQKEEYTKQFHEKSKELQGLEKLPEYKDFIIISLRILTVLTYIGISHIILRSIFGEGYWRAKDFSEWSWAWFEGQLFIFLAGFVGFIGFIIYVHIPEKKIKDKISNIKWKKQKEQRESKKTLNEDAKKDFFAQEAPKIKGEFILQFCLHQADDVVNGYTKELRTKKREAFDFIKRQEEYSKEVQSTFSSDSEKGKSLLQVIEERIFHTKFRMKNIDEMIAQSQQFKATLEQQAQKVVQKIKDREAERELIAKIQQDNGEELDLNLTDDEEMLDSFQTLETFLSESSCFVDMVKEMDNDSPIT